MNDNASGVGRLNKSPVAGRFRPYVGRKEKNFLEEVRAEARAQRKASERIDLEKLGSNNTEMDSEKPRVLEAPVLAEGRMGSRDYTKSTPSSLRAAVERMRRTRERLEKIDWDKVLTSKRMRSGDYNKSSKEASASYGKTVLPEASASCDKMDSDHLAYRNEGKQISPGKHVTVTGGDSQA